VFFVISLIFIISSSDSLHPNVLWAQDKKNLFLTFEVFEPKNENVEINEKTINFYAENDQGKYALNLELYSSVNPQESKTTRTDRSISVILAKPADSEWWPRLLSVKQKPNFLRTDFAKWREENESDNEGNRFGGGFGDYGAGNFPGMDYNDDFQDRDYGNEVDDAHSMSSDEEEHDHEEDKEEDEKHEEEEQEPAKEDQ
jgi:cytosolic prostaglandin-E synthase